MYKFSNPLILFNLPVTMKRSARVSSFNTFARNNYLSLIITTSLNSTEATFETWHTFLNLSHTSFTLLQPNPLNIMEHLPFFLSVTSHTSLTIASLERFASLFSHHSCLSLTTLDPYMQPPYDLSNYVLHLQAAYHTQCLCVARRYITNCTHATFSRDHPTFTTSEIHSTSLVLQQNRN